MSTPWYHYLHDVDRAAADAALLANDGANVTGKFLLRGSNVNDNEFILGVIFRGASTYHQITRAAPGLPFEVNKAPLEEECTTVDAVLEHLRTKRKRWPVPLTEGVLNAAAAEAEDSPAPSPVPESLAEIAAWFHPEADQALTVELLSADNGLEENGRFLLRPNPGSNDTMIVSVVYKKTVTHHLLARGPSGAMTVNGSELPAHTFAQSLEALRSKHKFWPVPLTTGIPANRTLEDLESPPPVPAAPGGDDDVDALPVGGVAISTPEHQQPQQQQQFPRKYDWAAGKGGAPSPAALAEPAAPASASEELGIFRPVNRIQGELAAAAQRPAPLSAATPDAIKARARAEADEIRRREEAAKAESDAAYALYKQQLQQQPSRAPGTAPVAPHTDTWRARKLEAFAGPSNTVGEFVPAVQKKVAAKRGEIPGEFRDAAAQSSQQQCTFLGNCKCPKCA